MTPPAEDGDGPPAGTAADPRQPAEPTGADEQPEPVVSRDQTPVGVFLRGLAMGAADAVPGVSGGTIALITGIYTRLIAALTGLDTVVARQLLADLRDDRRAVVGELRDRDVPFLVVLGTGVLTAIFTVARLLSVALATVPVLTYGFFFGLIAASAAVLYSELTLDTVGRGTAAVAGFLAAFLLSGRGAASLTAGPGTTVVAGAIAVSAMILPGISGSLLLIIIGQYERLVATIAALQDGVLAVLRGDPVGVLVDPLTTVAAFGTGAVVGLFTVAHAVRRALDRYPEATLAFLVSLIVGALRAPVAEASDALATAGRAWSPVAVGTFLAAGVVGALVVLLLDRAAGGISL